MKLAGATGALLSLALLGGCGSKSPAEPKADETADWSIPATFIDCDAAGVERGCIGKGEEGTYKPLAASDITKPWKICATVPHLKDEVWVAVNYGMTAETRRLGVEMQFNDAGGYTEVTNQVSQIENCVSNGANAIVIGAVSQDSLNPAIEAAVAKGVVVVDAGNGVTSPKVQGRAVVDYYEMGKAVGENLVKQNKALRVALLPGPAGAGWSERSAKGFKEAVAGSQVQLVDTKYGETGKEVQLRLVEDTLASHKDLDAIVGTAVTVDVAQAVLNERSLTDKIGLYGTYLNPTTLDLIKAGRAVCAPTEQPVMTFRIAVDTAVRLLEKKPLKEGFERNAPRPLMACGEKAGSANNIKSFDASTSFAPKGWKPVTTVKAKSN
ncbi:TMAO reductase system periplasmic protein TorT [Planosporangium flavigriseum]|uniref:TMAO reductase system periplasmic protein TorT n=1 Tax=Planosporangium flavigriseum TaxID=373681 RepID=A0A8J3LYH7_9ACTN|nr:TMAO reductase system periplasmic protein TorT [Planosporangium flavigriseum]NJC65851.1 TMAO reductase system periplasmic protein TorT [Planosporangium flavigriseum]GIG76104.1 TMAO reductase system periplasmic protein TorT [Planosporangium flavigriseum]